jgi:hypothetical protein
MTDNIKTSREAAIEILDATIEIMQHEGVFPKDLKMSDDSRDGILEVMERFLNSEDKEDINYVQVIARVFCNGYIHARLDVDRIDSEWVGQHSSQVNSKSMELKTKYDVPVCPCGCGNRNDFDGPATQESVDRMRKLMKDKRYCMEPETTFLTLRTPQEINKNPNLYKRIEEYTLEEYLEDAESEHDKWSFTSMYTEMITMNAWADSDQNRIEK